MDTQQAVNLELLRRFRTEQISFATPAHTVIRLSGDGQRESGGLGESNDPQARSRA
jgi:hypothetical protein